MPESIPHQILPLELDTKQVKELSQLNETLGKKLEQYGTLRPEMLAELTTAMKTILGAQTQFPTIAAAARDRQKIVHVTHADTNILNLPWRLATEDWPLLFLTKGKPIPEDLPILKADNPPLKILVMISSPEDSEWDNRLSYEEEETQIIQAFEPLFDSGNVQIDFTDDGSLENLKEKIAANTYHIVHFSGHGIYHKGKGYLALEDHQNMNQRLVTAADFAQVFQEKPENMPALIVLSSCQTAKGQLEQGMQSTADELLLKGLPAVVAMSVSVTDYFATYFASAMYQQLALKEPLHRAFQKAIAQTRVHESQKYPQLPPSQWMIPQLFVAKQLEHPVDWTKAAENLHYSAWKFVSGKEGLQTKKQEGYRFVGRRRDRKRIFQSLEKKRSVLLKGQGGVGKTAMAEYILQRLVAKDQRIHPFLFNETNASLKTVISSLETFLKAKKQRKKVLEIEERHKDDAYKQFQFLFAEVEELCQPLFIFDNLETFQSAPGEPFRIEYEDNLTRLVQFFYQEEVPLILTCRYSVAECPDIPAFDLNQVSRNDFLKKALQLSLKELPKKIRQQGLGHLLEERLTFREVLGWLHETFGGNYRALEFFDELYAKKKNKLPKALKTLADFKRKYADATEDTRQQMSKNLLFEELLGLLDAEEKLALRLLAHFRIPVLITALQMQPPDLKYAPLLATLLELTLLERHVDLENAELVYYYVTPLVKELSASAFKETIQFSSEQAGRYHRWVDQEINRKNYIDLEEAFYFFAKAKNGAALNETGETLCDFYYKTSQFQSALQYGLQVYELNREDANWRILNKIGMTFYLFGKGEQALFFFELCKNKAEADDDLENQGTTLNNISQIYDARGDYETALKYLEDSLQIRKQIGDKSGEGTTLNNMATIAHARGDYETALKYLEDSLQISQQIGDKSGEGTTLNNISQIFKARGDYETALKYLEDSLQISQQIGDKSGEGTTLNNISQIFKARGDYETALKYLEDSLQISQQIGDKSGEGRTLNNISQIFKARGDYETALNYLEDSLQVSKQIGDKQGEAYTLHNMAMIAKKNKDDQKYLEYEVKSYQIVSGTGDGYGVCIIGEALGVFLCESGQKEKGLALLENSLMISKNSNLPITDRINSKITQFKTQ